MKNWQLRSIETREIAFYISKKLQAKKNIIIIIIVIRIEAHCPGGRNVKDNQLKFFLQTNNYI